ncbi:MAG TPA: hypothetical protein VFW66_07000 [Gemmatimonadales bacterium]|nr:hypothetical protein [Gemmatimonadales bacterium]
MFFRAVVIWLAILVLASLNGALRDLLLAPLWLAQSRGVLGGAADVR